MVALSGLLPAAASLFAWLKGAQAEKFGSTIYAASVLGTTFIEMITGQATPVGEELFLDTAVAVGFLALAIRYNSLWLGAAMMAKGLQLAIHATRLTDGEDSFSGGVNLYALGLNVIALLIVGILVSGTIVTMTRRNRARRETIRIKRAPPTPATLVNG